MRYCEYCGTQLADNAVCTCQGAQLAANQQAQQQATEQQTLPGMQQPYAPPNPYNQPNEQFNPNQPYNPTPPYNPNPYAPPAAYPPVNNAVNNPPQPGRKMIKVSGILMTIFSSCALLVALSGLAFSAAVTEMDGFFGDYFNDYFGPSVYSEAFFSSMLTMLLSSGLMLAFGIMGIAFSKKPERGTAVMVLGIIMLALLVISTGLSLTYSNGMIVSMVMTNIISGSVLPILYVVGGYRRRKSSV